VKREILATPLMCEVLGRQWLSILAIGVRVGKTARSL
jgi:hypothetical protein